MAVYQAPNILDRVATGDDLYNIITQGDGRSKLVPSPDEVAEPGTPINRALLQPLMEAVQRSSEDLVPYNDYWWRIRQSAGSYSLKIVPFGQISGAYSTRTSDGAYVVSVVNRIVDSDGSVNSNGARTIQVASSVSVGSDGTISLVNPTSYTISADNISTYASTLNGKYAKGLVQNTDVVYKINTSGISSYQEAMDYGSYTRTTTHHCYTASSLTSTIVQIAAAEYTESNSDFSYVSNSDPEFYPHSGTSGGIEYQYIGRIYDAAVKAEPCNLQTVNITSASWTNGSCTIAIPHSRYLLWWGDSTDLHGGFLMVISGKCYGNYSYHYYSSSSYVTDEHEYHARGATKINTGNQASVTAIQFSTSGLTLTGSGAATFYYLPI